MLGVSYVFFFAWEENFIFWMQDMFFLGCDFFICFLSSFGLPAVVSVHVHYVFLLALGRQTGGSVAPVRRPTLFCLVCARCPVRAVSGSAPVIFVIFVARPVMLRHMCVY